MLKRNNTVALEASVLLIGRPYVGIVPPVVAHEFAGVLGLMDRLAGKELAQYGLDIEDRRSINGIECEDAQSRAISAEQPDDGMSEAVWPTLGALSKDSDLGPFQIVARVA